MNVLEPSTRNTLRTRTFVLDVVQPGRLEIRATEAPRFQDHRHARSALMDLSFNSRLSLFEFRPLLHRAICWRTDATSIGLSFEAQYKLISPEFTIPSRVLITIQSPSIYASSPPIWILLQFGRDADPGKAEIRLLIQKQCTSPSLYL